MLLVSFIVRPVSTFLRQSGRGAAQVFRGMNRLATIWQNRRDVVRLSQLSAHELKDIGLTRSDVVGALETGWFEDPSLALAARSGILQENAASRRSRTGDHAVATTADADYSGTSAAHCVKPHGHGAPVTC